jgi:hypothetical protein
VTTDAFGKYTNRCQPARGNRSTHRKFNASRIATSTSGRRRIEVNGATTLTALAERTEACRPVSSRHHNSVKLDCYVASGRTQPTARCSIERITSAATPADAARNGTLRIRTTRR